MGMKRTLALGIVGILFIAIALLIASCSPMRSETSIRASLLKHTPVGSSASEVRAFAEKKGWLDQTYAGTNLGFYKQEPGEPPYPVGVSSLRGDLGHYYLPFRTDVAAFWGFDTNGRLIDVWVWKETDAP